MVKVLVCGDIRGDFANLRARVAALQSSMHGPFHMILCCGVFVGNDEQWEQLTAGVSMPIPLYFMGTPPASLVISRSQSEPTQISENIFCLGEDGIHVIQRLCVAFVSTDSSQVEKQALQAALTVPEYMGCDLLLSQLVPKDVHHFLPDSEAEAIRSASMAGSQEVTDIAQQALPRYHFASSSSFFQRAPYKNFDSPPTTKKTYISRFITLAPSSQSKDKSKKWLHALDLEPLGFMTLDALFAESSGITELPYIRITAGGTRVLAQDNEGDTMKKRLRGQTDECKEPARPQSFFFGDMGVPVHAPKRSRTYGNQSVDPENKTIFVGGLPLDVDEAVIRGLFATIDCTEIAKVRCVYGKPFAFVELFSHEAAADVLSRAQAEPLMIGSQSVQCGWGIQSHSRAPRPEQTEEMKRLSARTDCWFCLGSPSVEAHLLVSIGTYLYLAMPKGAIVDEHILIIPIDCISSRMSLSVEGKAELERYVAALRGYFESKGEKLMLFERFMPTKGSQHFHIQVLPIPEAHVHNCLSIFLEEAERIKVTFQEMQEVSMNPDDVLERDYYFFIELPTSSGRRKYIHTLTEGEVIPMQFGREIAAKVLDMPQRAHWKDCLLSTRNETIVAEQFKQNFKHYDFTLR